MRIVVIGGTGLIGSKVVAGLAEHGHEAIAASPSSGVNTLTGEGLDDVCVGANAVVDVSNSPSFEDRAVMDFFTTSTRNLLAAEKRARVGHHIALSVVGSERMSDSGYFRAKMAQEKLIRASGLGYSIVHATQFYEFLTSIADAATDAAGDAVRLAPVPIRPIAAADVAIAVARTCVWAPLLGTREVCGPEVFLMPALIARVLRARNDPREVVADPAATYFNATVTDHELLPSDGAIVSATRYDDWLADNQRPLTMQLA